MLPPVSGRCSTAVKGERKRTLSPFRAAFSVAACLLVLTGCLQLIHPPSTTSRAPKVAVVLGAGASRGFAHIGVLKVLESNHIPIDMIVGASAGSFVASLYASGIKAYDLQKMAISLDQSDIIDFAIPDNGFIKGESLEKYVNGVIKNAPLERLPIPFFAVATSLPEGRETVFATGNTGTAVRASCSIPGVFRPTKIGNVLYVDGGVVSPVPVEAAREKGADIVIAVDISADLDKEQPDGTIATILQAVNVMYSKLATQQDAKADIVIKPKVGWIGSADFFRRHEAIMEGEKAALAVLPKINGLISDRRNGVTPK